MSFEAEALSTAIMILRAEGGLVNDAGGVDAIGVRRKMPGGPPVAAVMKALDKAAKSGSLVRSELRTYVTGQMPPDGAYFRRYVYTLPRG